MGRRLTRTLAATAVAGGLLTASVALAAPGPPPPPPSQGGGQQGGGQPGSDPPGAGQQGPGRPGSSEHARRDCRPPGKDLQPVKAGAVGAGGQINIEGAGRVTLDGSFMTWGTLRGMTIRVLDQGGDGMVRIGAACVPMAPGGGGTRIAMLRNPRGRFLVDGTDLRVDISGRGSLAIAVTGSGTGVLNGVGTFTVNNGSPKSWPLKPIDLALAPTS